MLQAAKHLSYSHVKDISKCTHLIADEAKRTIKFLCALSKGVHIVTSQWLLQSQKAGKSLGGFWKVPTYIISVLSNIWIQLLGI